MTLLSRHGYLKQVIDGDGRQLEEPDPWEPAPWAQPPGAKVAVSVAGHGWWMEACIEGTTGWAIGDAELGTAGDDAEDLYHALEDRVLPTYYGDRARWIWMMKQSISKIASCFNSQRMMRRYASEAYLR